MKLKLTLRDMALEIETRYWHAKAKEARVVREQLGDAEARQLPATIIATYEQLAENAARLPIDQHDAPNLRRQNA
jgi:hypothetical protein